MLCLFISPNPLRVCGKRSVLNIENINTMTNNLTLIVHMKCLRHDFFLVYEFKASLPIRLAQQQNS